MENLDLARLRRKRDLHIILPVFLVSIIACIDRVNIAYAKLTMEQDLPWLTPEIFGMGASIFFVGYLHIAIDVGVAYYKFLAHAISHISNIKITYFTAYFGIENNVQ